MTVAPVFTYAATVQKVIDGDTIDLDLDLGMRIHSHTRIRVAHIDTPEVNTQRGRDVRDLVRDLLPVGAQVVVTTQKPDKFGRALADVQLPDGQDLATLLLQGGHAVEYEGGAR